MSYIGMQWVLNQQPYLNHVLTGEEVSFAYLSKSSLPSVSWNLHTQYQKLMKCNHSGLQFTHFIKSRFQHILANLRLVHQGIDRTSHAVASYMNFSTFISWDPENAYFLLTLKANKLSGYIKTSNFQYDQINFKAKLRFCFSSYEITNPITMAPAFDC